MARSSSIDPSRYTSLALTHVRYDPEDPFSKILSLATLSPIFLLCSYVTIILYRRELTFINALLGQLSCEGLNWLLKRLIRQPRPTEHFGSGYGMPSSHSQFLGFFAAFFLAHFGLNRPPPMARRTIVGTMRRLEHDAAMVAIAVLATLTCYSRHHLHYHTPAQIFVGVSLGLLYGGAYYYLTEHLTRKPLRLPSPLGVGADSSSIAIKANRLLVPSSTSDELRQRKAGERDRDMAPPSSAPRAHSRPRRSSSLADRFLPDLYPAPPLRQMILDHPVAVAFRIRDSWTVWKDGGIEGEYGAWRREWERRRRPWNHSRSPFLSSDDDDDGSSSLAGQDHEDDEEDTHFRLMLTALRDADRCVPLTTAFCVGCVISIRPSPAGATKVAERVLATGFSRELPGNTHAEQCALDKLVQQYGHQSSPADANEAGPDRGQGNGSSRTVMLDLYTTMEPCSERLSGNLPCVQRILSFNESARAGKMLFRLPGSAESVRLVIERVFQGVSEPTDFVLCQGARMLREAGIQVKVVQPNRGPGDGWLERECLRIAKKGHEDEPQPEDGAVAMWKK